MDLSDNDFEIVNNKGSANTNLDALSQINRNCDTLKEIILIETEQKLLSITCSMIRQNEIPDSKYSAPSKES